MLAMDQIHHIRALFYEQGYNISDIAKATGRDWKTVAKYIDMADFNEPLPAPASQQRFCPKLDPYKGLIDSWLKEDKKHNRKQRHTAKKVFARLSKEVPGFNCSYRLVAEYFKARKKELNLKRDEGFLPLEHHPGEAQSDFGSAEFYEHERHISGKYLVLSFPWSNAGYLQLFYGENLECLLEGLTPQSFLIKNLKRCYLQCHQIIDPTVPISPRPLILIYKSISAISFDRSDLFPFIP